MNTHIGDIYIIYSKKDKRNINEIKKIITNNYDLILDFLDNKRVIDLTKIDFNTFFNEAVDTTFKNKELVEIYTKKEFISFLNVEYIIRKNNYYSNITLEQKSILSDEIILNLLAYKYYEENGTYDEFKNFLKNKDNIEIINNWLNNNYRWETYNYLVEQITNQVYKNDDLDYLIQDWFNRHRNINDIDYNEDDTEEENEKINDLDLLFKGFLQYINAPYEWLNIYNNLMDRKFIIDKEGNKSELLSRCYLDEDDDEYKIIIYNRNTTKGFFVFIHEFIHYISKYKNERCKNEMISELPSIYYEKEVNDYLLLNGYNTKNLLNIREKDNRIVYNCLYPIYSFVKDEKKFIDDDLNENCDILIDYLIRNYYMILKGFGYLISTYLVDRINESNEQDSNDKMIYVSNNLNQLDINEIMELFNIKVGKKLIKEK